MSLQLHEWDIHIEMIWYGWCQSDWSRFCSLEPSGR